MSGLHRSTLHWDGPSEGSLAYANLIIAAKQAGIRRMGTTAFVQMRRAPATPRKKAAKEAWRGAAHRVALYRAQGGKCGICGARMKNLVKPTLDHVVPIARGGLNVGNLLLVHPRCNQEKADREPTMGELETLAVVNAALSTAP